MKKLFGMKKLFSSISLLILTVILCTVSVFAWFIGGNTSIKNIEFETGEIVVDVRLFSVSDFNCDGIPDRNAAGKVSLNDIKNTGMLVKNAQPGQVFSFRMEAQNFSANSVYFALRMENPLGTAGLNAALTFNTVLQPAIGESIAYKVPLAGGTVAIIDAENTANPELSGRIPLIELPLYKEGEGNSATTFDFSLKFEHLDYLKMQAETAPLFQGKSNLNDFLNLSLFDTESGKGSRFYFEFRQSIVSAASGNI